MDFNEVLESIIKNTLENIDSQKISYVMKLLKDLGVEKPCHFKYVQESDLSGHLNKIQTRMLIESFKNAANGSGDKVIQTYVIKAELPPQLVLPELPLSRPELPSSSLPELTSSSIPELPSSSFPELPSSPCPVECDNDVNISWHLLGASVISKLKNGKNLKISEFRSMVRIIVNDILKVNSNPPRRLLVKVAEKCVTKYPVLKEKFSSITLGTGYDNLAYRLNCRLENLRRKSCPSRHKAKAVDAPLVEKRRMPIYSYGCVAWEVNLPKGITEEELISKKNILSQLNDESEIDLAIKLLEETYYLQRSSINNCDAIEKLLKDWPILFTAQGIESHFKILTNIDLYRTLENTIFSKGRNLVSFWRSCNSEEVKAFIFETDTYCETPNELLLIVLGLGKYFAESSSTVFFTDEVFNPHKLSNLPKHPCLVGKGTSILRCEEFMLTIDGIVVNTSLKDPGVAVASWFAAYYIFNFMYPSGFACSLEFLQRCLVGINPVCGSKVERKKKKYYQGVHPKIFKLLNKLNEFDSFISDFINK